MNEREQPFIADVRERIERAAQELGTLHYNESTRTHRVLHRAGKLLSEALDFLTTPEATPEADASPSVRDSTSQGQQGVQVDGGDADAMERSALKPGDV